MTPDLRISAFSGMIIYFLRLMNSVYSSLGYSSALHLANILHSYVFCLYPTALYLDCACMVGLETMCLSHYRDQTCTSLQMRKRKKFGLQMHQTESFARWKPGRGSSDAKWKRYFTSRGDEVWKSDRRVNILVIKSLSGSPTVLIVCTASILGDDCINSCSTT